MSATTQRGVAAVREYFDWRRWIDFGVTSRHDKDRLFTLSKAKPPSFGEGRSLSEIAASLRDLGDIKALMRGGNRDLKDAGGDDPKLPPGSDDAFALWREHYRYYASPAMVERLKAIESCFTRMFSKGASFDLRLLDHGVCSGLLLLQFITSYYQIVVG